MILYIVILAVLVGLDQLLKYWTVTHLALGESAPLLPGIMRLTRLHNYGAAWSSLSGKTAVLLVVKPRWIWIRFSPNGIEDISPCSCR